MDRRNFLIGALAAGGVLATGTAFAAPSLDEEVFVNMTNALQFMSDEGWSHHSIELLEIYVDYLMHEEKVLSHTDLSVDYASWPFERRLLKITTINNTKMTFDLEWRERLYWKAVAQMKNDYRVWKGIEG